MPGEFGAALQEEAVEVVEGLGEAGQAEVERAEADADDVVRGGRAGPVGDPGVVVVSGTSVSVEGEDWLLAEGCWPGPGR
ncbi:hypothetical protein [Streptomyces sp. MNU89]|uniref:hypothetical protein n=1 Tax=Streptomyces sp. MNU89 TaxID=2560025 RepID=UPI001E413F91|nr:hypothetical protein [Streptomyces sp. MNU89]MCC9738801.1 hypothetical protein [Streptomyces sp. MNU89]